MKKIVFVCYGNLERSVVAELSLKKILAEKRLGEDFEVFSYGLQGTMGTELPRYPQLQNYQHEWKAAAPILSEFKLDISQHNFQKITDQIVAEADVIIAMDAFVYQNAGNALLIQFPNYKNKIHLFSEVFQAPENILDPYGSGDESDHRKVIEAIYFPILKNFDRVFIFLK